MRGEGQGGKRQGEWIAEVQLAPYRDIDLVCQAVLSGTDCVVWKGDKNVVQCSEFLLSPWSPSKE